MAEKACIVGLGFIGLPLAVALASRGAEIKGYEIRDEVVEKINKGIAPIYEPGLEEELKKVVESGKLVASSDPAIIREAGFVIITVGTPVDENGVPKLDYVESACEIIGKNLKKGAIVVLKSTVPPGTTEEFVKPRLEQHSGMKCPEDFGVAFCPERTVEGQAMQEFLTLPKVVGGINQDTTDKVSAFFSILNDKIVKVSKPRTAEMVKLMDNTYRDVNIALANEFAKAGMALGVDVKEATAAANKDYSRNHILISGTGVGGSCLTKDPLILNTTVRKKGGPNLDLVLQGREVNKKMPEFIVNLGEKVLERNGKTISNSKIALLGLAFKKDTNDLRNT
ncbi:MAG: nucleotide sugar dehydrogenase, partial [archaeon]